MNSNSLFLHLGPQFCSCLIILVSAFSPGWLIFKWLFKKDPVQEMEWLITVGFGLIFLSGLGFVLGAAHLFQRPFLLPVLALLSAASLGIGYQKKMHPRFFPSPLEKTDYLPLLVLLGFLSLTLIQSLAPPQKWDEQVYHLLLPKLYLAHGGFFRVVSNIYAGFPQNQEVIYGMLLALSDPVSPRLFHFLIGLLTLLVLWNFGKEIFAAAGAGIWAMILFGVSGIYHLEASSAYLDLALCFYTLLSVYSAYQYRDRQNWSWLLAAGIFAGGALGTKNLALAPVLVTGFLIILWSKPHRWRNRLGYFAAAFIFLAPWFAKNFVLIGNPFYPFFAGVFPGGEWDQTLLNRYVYSAQLEGMGRSWLDYLLLFPRLFLKAREESFWFDACFNPLLFFLSLASFLWAKVRKELWLWLWFFLAFFLWAVGPQHGRYILPGIAILALICGGACQEILSWSGKSFSWVLSLLILSLSLGFLPARVWKVTEEIKFITGRLQLEEYLLRNRNRLGLLRINELLALNRLTPADARLFLLWENRGFYLEREYLADSLFEVSYTKHLIAQLGSADNFHQWLKENNFSYLYNGRTWKWDTDAYLLPETRDESRKAQTIYQEFVKRYGEVIFREQGELIRVK